MALVQDAEAEPERDFIQDINSQRNIEFKRWRLKNDPESKASQDAHYVSAIKVTNEPIKTWPGEVGAVVLGNGSILTTPTTGQVAVALGLYQAFSNRPDFP